MNGLQDFGRLVDVDPRQAWAHEAHAFTPWLADNLDQLSDAIGIPLELTGREVGVGRYSADILARDVAGDRAVLIENQLAPSDHTHLGQILTYLAGLEAQIVVWLAPEFREEHLSALRWLNAHTDERFAFFAVRLRVVQIADSPLAPLFDVLEKPNSWDRSLQSIAKVAVELSQPTAQREAFWDVYAQSDPLVLQERRTGPGGSNRWRTVPGTDFVVNRCKAKAKVGIFIRVIGDADYSVLSRRMEPHLAALEKELGAAPSEWSSFWKDGPSITEDPQTWPPAIAWLQSETDRYVAVVQRMFSKEA